MAPLIDDPARAASLLRKGGVVACPAEAVFGLDCDPMNETALARIVALKGRDDAMGFIVVAADEEQLAPFLGPLTGEMRGRIRPTWPGPVTWLCPARAGLPPLLTGGRETIAVRVTAHPPLAALCRVAGAALVSTSANRSGERPARDAATVDGLFGDLIDGIVAGTTGGRERPTEIRDALTGAVVRG